MALPRVRGREDTFVDVTGQEWARARPAAEEAPESRPSVRSSEGTPFSPAIADPRRAEQADEDWDSRRNLEADSSSRRVRARTGKVGSEDANGLATQEVGGAPCPLSEGREDNRENRVGQESTETEELVKLRALTNELSNNLCAMAGLGERDPVELERLLRNTLRYLRARQAALQRRRKYNAVGLTWTPLEPGIHTSRFCDWSAQTAAQVDEAERLLLENSVTPETLRR